MERERKSARGWVLEDKGRNDVTTIEEGTRETLKEVQDEKEERREEETDGEKRRRSTG